MSFSPHPVAVAGIRTAVGGAVAGAEHVGAGANNGFAWLKDGRVVGSGAIFSEPTEKSRYWTPLAVDWTPQGWFRPGGYLAKPPAKRGASRRRRPSSRQTRRAIAGPADRLEI